ncbi:hypothetical protein ACFQ4K_28880 [Tistrella bauzanensis]
MNSGQIVPENRRRKVAPWTERLIRGTRVGQDPAPSWLMAAYDQFHAKVTDAAYPCFSAPRPNGAARCSMPVSRVGIWPICQRR